MTRASLSMLALSILTLGCLADPRPDSDYCGNNDGDAFCERMAAQAPYCVLSTQSCYDAAGIAVGDQYGCVATPPAAECRAACGIGNGDDCTDPTDPSSSSTTEDETDSSTTEDPTMDTESSSSSTTGPECIDGMDVECTDAGLPFCIEDMCQSCNADEMPDERCEASSKGATPYCDEKSGDCVQCTEAGTEQCGGMLCDVESSSCAPCQWHEECQDVGAPACDFTTGMCFDPTTARTVNLGTPNALQEAVSEVANGEHVALRLTGSEATNHSATVSGGKVIALVSPNGSTQNVEGAANTILTVEGDSTAILHRVRLDGSDGVGIDVQAGGTLWADATQVSGNGGGGITLASGSTATLRNCMVGGDASDVPAVNANDATLDLLYSTVLAGLGNSDGLTCDAGGSVTVRNSIITTRGSMPALSCQGAVLTDTAVEDSANTDWFDGYNAGDAHLDTDGQTEFMNIATWREGDPLVDFDGQPRPNSEGASDYAGADVP